MAYTHITQQTFAGLVNGRIAYVAEGKARLRCQGEQFVMEGPSGKHTLQVWATDRIRLDMHWKNFCGHKLNSIARAN